MVVEKRREGCKASDLSSRLRFNVCQWDTMSFLRSSGTISSHFCDDNKKLTVLTKSRDISSRFWWLPKQVGLLEAKTVGFTTS